MKIETTGRTDIEDYFEKSGIRSYRQLNHTPFLVFLEEKNKIKVEIVDSGEKLLTYPPKTKVMAQWKGEWRSDFFQFEVLDLILHIAGTPKNEYQII